MKVCILDSRTGLSMGDGTSTGLSSCYARLGISKREVELTTSTFEDFEKKEQFVHDAYIVDDRSDARALLLGAYLANTERLFGVSFANSPESNPSQVGWRSYYSRRIFPFADFVLQQSSHSATRGDTNNEKGVPRYILVPKFPEMDIETLRSRVRAKVESLVHTKRLMVAYVGNCADSPSRGVEALLGQSEELVALRRAGFNVQVTIMLDGGAITTDTLAILRRVPVRYVVENWTKEKEALVLQDSFLSLLPADRAATSDGIQEQVIAALSNGTQILIPAWFGSSPFDALIYRDARRLLLDIERQTTALRGETVQRLADLITEVRSRNRGCGSLSNFLSSCGKRVRHDQRIDLRHPFAAVIHGANVGGAIHKFTHRLGALSVASSFSESRLKHAVRFVINSGTIDVLIWDKLWALLPQDVCEQLKRLKTIDGLEYYAVGLSYLLPEEPFYGLALAQADTPASFAAAYGAVASITERAMHALFPGIACIHSEYSALPWRVQSQTVDGLK